MIRVCECVVAQSVLQLYHVACITIVLVLQVLLPLVPTSEEVTLLQDYEGDRSQLGKVEKTFMAVMDVPQYEARLKCLKFKLQFNDLLAEIEGKSNSIRRALDDIADSGALKGSLAFILAVGNYLNGSTSRGAAYGFKLDVLGKLATVKSWDNKTTLLQWMVREARRGAAVDAKPLLRVPCELEHVAPATGESLDQLLTDGKNVEANLKLVQSTCSSIQGGAGGLSGDKFPDVMGAFVKEHQAAVDKMMARLEQLADKFAAVAKSFMEDPKRTDTLVFLPVFSKFATALTKAIEKDEEDEQKEKKAEKDAKRGPASTPASPASPRGGKGGDLVDAKFGAMQSAARGGASALMAQMKQRQAQRARKATVAGGRKGGTLRRAGRASVAPGSMAALQE